MKITYLNEDKQTLNEGPLDLLDPKGAAKRAVKKSDRAEEARKKKEMRVLAKDFSKEWKDAQFHLPKYPEGGKLQRNKPFSQDDWKRVFGDLARSGANSPTSGDMFTLWHDALVTSPAGRILRRGAEDLDKDVIYLIKNKNDKGDKKYYIDTRNSKQGGTELPNNDVEGKGDPKGEDDPKGQEPKNTKSDDGSVEQVLDDQKGEPGQRDYTGDKINLSDEKDTSTSDDTKTDPEQKETVPKQKRPAIDYGSLITDETVERFKRLVALAKKEGYDFKVLGPDKKPLTNAQIKSLTKENILDVRVPKSGKYIKFGPWFYSTRSLKLLENMSIEELKETLLTEAPNITFTPDDMFDPAVAPSLSGKMRQAIEDERAAAEAQRVADRRAQLRKKHASLLDEVKSLMETMNKPSDVLEHLFEELVPPDGMSETVAGEMVRASMRVLYRDYNDGDKFYEGYGLETCGSSIAYLMDMIPSVSEKVSKMYDDIHRYEEDDDAYTDAIENIALLVIQHIIENPETLDDLNTTDSRNYDYDELTEQEPRYDYELSVSEDLDRLIDEGYVNSWELKEYVESELEYHSELEGAEVERPWGQHDRSVTISKLTKDGLSTLDDWNNNLDSFWSELVSEHQDDLDAINSDDNDEEYEDDEDNIEEELSTENRYYLQSGDEILSGMIDNLKDDELDQSVKDITRAARLLKLSRPEDLVVFVDTEMIYDPVQLDQQIVTSKPELHTVKNIELVSQNVNGNVWLYFKNETDAEKYLTYMDVLNYNI